MPAPITWQNGGAATIVKIVGEEIELRSAVPFAPGSRPEATLDATGARVWVKVHGSHGQPDGSYRVEARVLNATRAFRAVLERAVGEPPA